MIGIVVGNTVEVDELYARHLACPIGASICCTENFINTDCRGCHRIYEIDGVCKRPILLENPVCPPIGGVQHMATDNYSIISIDERNAHEMFRCTAILHIPRESTICRTKD